DGMLRTIRFNSARLEEAASDEMLAATDVADLLVRHGVPFREAHGIVGGLVRTALDQGKALSELTQDELAERSPLLGEDFYAVLRERAWVEGKVSRGGTSLTRVREQLDRAKLALR